MEETEVKLGLHVLIDEELKNTSNSFGTNLEMRRMAKRKKPLRIERVSRSRNSVTLINPDTRNDFTFDIRDLKLIECEDKKPQEFYFDESELLEV